jgi:hypothetical protein
MLKWDFLKKLISSFLHEIVNLKNEMKWKNKSLKRMALQLDHGTKKISISGKDTFLH